MIINRLIYLFALMAAVIFYILYPPWISWYLLVLLLLMIPIDLFVSIPGMRCKYIKLSAPVVLEKDEAAVLWLTTTQTKSYPVRWIIVKLLVTGDDFSIVSRPRCSGETGRQREVMIDTSHSGLTVFEAKRIFVVSLLGLFSKTVKIEERQPVLVLPPAVKPLNTVELQRGTHLYPKPGGGFSEEHDIREYRQGDPVRSIHWKASAKYDSLMIREPLVPPPHSRLIHVDPWKTGAERDIILGCLRWVTEYMLTRQMPFYVQFGEVSVIKEIKQAPDLIEFLLCVLDKNDNKTIKSDQVPSRFSWIFRIDAGSGRKFDEGDETSKFTQNGEGGNNVSTTSS